MNSELNLLPINIQLFADPDTPPASVTADEMLAQLGDEEAAARIEAAKAATTPPATTPPADDPATPPASDVPPKDDPATPPASDVPADDPATPPGGKAKPNPMKEVRDQLNAEKSLREKTTKAVQRLADGEYEFKLKDFKNEEGVVDYDLLITAMDEADVKAQAESKGISPEVQAEINRIEKEKVELQKQQLQVQMDRALITLQQEMGVKSDQINGFFADAMAKKYNPYMWLAQGGNLQDLYITVYRDRLLKAEVDKAVEAARSVWEADARKKVTTPAANPAAPASPQPQVAKDGIDFNAMLDAVVKK